jgi:hypothetical protein
MPCTVLMDVMIKAASCCREWLRQHLPLYGTAVPESPSPPPAATSAPAPTPAVTDSGNGEANSGAAPAAVEGCANDTGSDSESGYQSDQKLGPLEVRPGAAEPFSSVRFGSDGGTWAAAGGRGPEALPVKAAVTAETVCSRGAGTEPGSEGPDAEADGADGRRAAGTGRGKGRQRWLRYTGVEGRKYWFDRDLQQSSWEKPPEHMSAKEQRCDLSRPSSRPLSRPLVPSC